MPCSLNLWPATHFRATHLLPFEKFVERTGTVGAVFAYRFLLQVVLHPFQGNKLDPKFGLVTSFNVRTGQPALRAKNPAQTTV